MGAKRITPEEIKEFYRLYEEYGTFAEVARRTKRSAQSVAKYVNPKNLKALQMAARQEIVKEKEGN